jgi:hypothetical protein
VTSASCFWCDTVPAPYAVITGAEGDEKGDVTRVKHQWACCDCTKKSLLELLRVARERADSKSKAAPT